MADLGKDKPTWVPPKIWDGQTVFILGGGPSLALSQLNLIHDCRVLAVNDAFRNFDGSVAQWVDACYFGDCKWWDWNRRDEELENGIIKKGINAFGGLKMTSCQRLYHIPILNTWKRGKPQGIERKPGFISWNACSGLSAINVAYHFGAKRIVLLGFDMGGSGENEKKVYNWHKWHKSRPNKGSYKGRFLRCVPAIATDAKRLNIELINASVHTAIHPDLIQRKKLEDCL